MSTNHAPTRSALFTIAVQRIDSENARDPNTQTVDGVDQPRELLYSRWLTDWVAILCPDASEALLLAARAQHICRWTIARDQYPATRTGYLRWREALKKFHAEKAGDILRETGYPEDVIHRVQELNLKKNFPHDPESRVLEDALCLVFMQHQLAEFAGRTRRKAVINALQKSWRKMTPAAQARALKLPLGEREKALLQEALAESA
jgi:hypothetical protein